MTEYLQFTLVPLFLFIALASALAVTLLIVSRLLGPRKKGAVKEMPYESGMDPIHDTRRRFDVRFHLVAITFLLFDVELLFLYPWAVASRRAPTGELSRGIDAAVSAGWVDSRMIVFGGVMFFIALVTLGFVYDWKKGVFKWR